MVRTRTLMPLRAIFAKACVPLAVGTKYGDTSARSAAGAPRMSCSWCGSIASRGAVPRVLRGSSLTMRVCAHSRLSSPLSNWRMKGRLRMAPAYAAASGERSTLAASASSSSSSLEAAFLSRPSTG
ncbi:hypothetical protein D3C72_1441560 [compost metagenome]